MAKIVLLKIYLYLLKYALSELTQNYHFGHNKHIVIMDNIGLIYCMVYNFLKMN